MVCNFEVRIMDFNYKKQLELEAGSPGESHGVKTDLEIKAYTSSQRV